MCFIYNLTKVKNITPYVLLLLRIVSKIELLPNLRFLVKCHDMLQCDTCRNIFDNFHEQLDDIQFVFNTN